MLLIQTHTQPRWQNMASPEHSNNLQDTEFAFQNSKPFGHAFFFVLKPRMILITLLKFITDSTVPLLHWRHNHAVPCRSQTKTCNVRNQYTLKLRSGLPGHESIEDDMASLAGSKLYKTVFWAMLVHTSHSFPISTARSLARKAATTAPATTRPQFWTLQSATAHPYVIFAHSTTPAMVKKTFNQLILGQFELRTLKPTSMAPILVGFHADVQRKQLEYTKSMSVFSEGLRFPDLKHEVSLNDRVW